MAMINGLGNALLAVMKKTPITVRKGDIGQLQTKQKKVVGGKTSDISVAAQILSRFCVSRRDEIAPRDLHAVLVGMGIEMPELLDQPIHPNGLLKEYRPEDAAPGYIPIRFDRKWIASSRMMPPHEESQQISRLALAQVVGAIANIDVLEAMSQVEEAQNIPDKIISAFPFAVIAELLNFLPSVEARAGFLRQTSKEGLEKLWQKFAESTDSRSRERDFFDLMTPEAINRLYSQIVVGNKGSLFSDRGVRAGLFSLLDQENRTDFIQGLIRKARKTGYRGQPFEVYYLDRFWDLFPNLSSSDQLDAFRILASQDEGFNEVAIIAASINFPLDNSFSSDKLIALFECLEPGKRESLLALLDQEWVLKDFDRFLTTNDFARLYALVGDKGKLLVCDAARYRVSELLALLGLEECKKLRAIVTKQGDKAFLRGVIIEKVLAEMSGS